MPFARQGGVIRAWKLTRECRSGDGSVGWGGGGRGENVLGSGGGRGRVRKGRVADQVKGGRGVGGSLYGVFCWPIGRSLLAVLYRTRLSPSYLQNKITLVGTSALPPSLFFTNHGR